MRLLSAIYGFEITRPISYGSWRIEPIIDSPEQANTLARDPEAYNLTAIVVGDTFPENERFKLEGVLCFIEHLDVIVFPAIQLIDDAEPDASKLPRILRRQRRHSGVGAVIARDLLFHQSRTDFLTLAMSKLSDDEFCKSTKFNILFFKCIETFRQRSPFLEISYFLLFSGLESFARASLNDTKTRDAAKPIYSQLSSYGLNVVLEDLSDLPRSIRTYARLRNSLFHNSEFRHTIHIGNSEIQLDATTYFFHLSMLVNLTILKAVGFDDGHTNWEAWLDRQMHY
ncbi:hypothetical protein [Undibacterium danionis]|uniref:Apea-like HEPN domain-containing protein n=1 Tax=Undibacterium danionis TaxID=1812100 RepID=A0ABV6IBI4_9BURK